MGKLSLSDKRLGEIVDEVDAQMRIAEDIAIRERLGGLRCSCCNTLMKTPSPSGECPSCQEL